MDAIIGAGKMTEKDTPDVYIQTYRELPSRLAPRSEGARIIKDAEGNDEPG